MYTIVNMDAAMDSTWLTPWTETANTDPEAPIRNLFTSLPITQTVKREQLQCRQIPRTLLPLR